MTGQARSIEELSALARLGSGSASRSVPGGWAVWEGKSARQVHPADHWEVRLVVAVCAAGQKSVGSRDGMRAAKETSPYHPAWIEQCRRDLPEERDEMHGQFAVLIGREPLPADGLERPEEGPRGGEGEATTSGCKLLQPFQS